MITLATTLSVTALPLIHDWPLKLVAKYKEDSTDSEDIIDTSASMSYPFA